MSLISQNTTTRKTSKHNKTKKGDPEVIPETKKRKKGSQSDNESDNDEVEELENMKEAERKLENLLFSSIYSPLQFGKDSEETTGVFFSDRSAAGTHGEKNWLLHAEEIEEQKPVWVDEEEEVISVNIAKVNRLRKLRVNEEESLISGLDFVSRLRSLHVKMNPGAEWAQIDQDPNMGGYTSDSSDEHHPTVVTPPQENDITSVLRTSDDLIVKHGPKLHPGLLEYSRLLDANAEDPSTGPVKSVHFHKNSQLLLTAGLDRRLGFFQVDGKRNSKIQSIFLEDCPIHKASFTPDGSQVIVSGGGRFFYCFDLVKAKLDRVGPLTGREERNLKVFDISPDSSTIAFIGDGGYILLVSSKTRDLIGTLKMNGVARSLAFAEDGRHLLASGDDGHVYHWDLRTRSCFHKGVDEGCLSCTSLCTSPTGELFAAGSSSGIVNIYNRAEFLGGNGRPTKVVENLTTMVEFMKFSSDTQILAVGSSRKRNGLKLIHIPSYTVFSNWPPFNRTLHYPRALDFSPGGGFMAVGNSLGKVLLYKLHHYQHA